MSTSTTGALVGRVAECGQLDELLADVRAGRSRTLALRGDPGAGKTALLRHVGRAALGCTVLRATGVESEMELAYAGLHQLCLPLLDRLERLPEPQREALATAFGLSGGTAPDRFMVGLAVTGLLSAAAREGPVVCLVDDAQWLDRASAETVAFVARRLGAQPVALVATFRGVVEGEPDWGLPEMTVGRLPDRAARILLQSVLPGPIDAEVLRRLLDEADGNPLALTELPHGLSVVALAGGFGMPDAGTLRSRIELSYARRVEALPEPTRRLLLVAAAEPRQDPVLIWRAAATLRIPVAAAAPAVTDELVDFGGEVRFRHPLVRSAVYRTASAVDRRLVHRALAEATDRDADPDRRAWHRAHATAGLDESVASELERSADRAKARGGFAAAAAFHERATALTPDPARRVGRALAAALCTFHAGAPQRALRILAAADAGAADELTAARMQLLRAQICAATGHGDEHRLLDAAELLEPLDKDLARETYRDASYAALNAGRLAHGDGMREVAEAVQAAVARATTPVDQRPAMARLVEGLASIVVDGYAVGAPVVQSSLAVVRRETLPTEVAMRWLPLAVRMCHDVWDDDAWAELADRATTQARDSGQLRVLPVALISGVALRLFEGDLAAATALAEEVEVVAAVTDRPAPPYAPLVLAAWRGSDHETEALLADEAVEAATHREGQWITTCAWAGAVLHSGRGRYDEALTAAQRGAAHPEELGIASWSMVELVEAAARAGVPERGRAAAARLTEIGEACGTDWALGTAARSRALLTEGPEAEAGYREAVERLARTRIRWMLARTQLVYGEWLRREGRRTDAREQLTAAHDLLADMGAAGFAERARREIAATGATARRRSVETAVDLTEQEAQIARLAAEGRTNPEVAGVLYISPRTVEWHLRKVYSKLGITSRKELAGALAATPARAAGARPAAPEELH